MWHIQQNEAARKKTVEDKNQMTYEIEAQTTKTSIFCRPHSFGIVVFLKETTDFGAFSLYIFIWVFTSFFCFLSNANFYVFHSYAKKPLNRTK